jgi:hypothetical protein
MHKITEHCSSQVHERTVPGQRRPRNMAMKYSMGSWVRKGHDWNSWEIWNKRWRLNYRIV